MTIPIARWRWVLAGLAVLIFGLLILEYRQPYYFVQDDNFAECLPVILEGCRSLIRGGILDWSPYQFLGFPVARIGGYALTYPPTYLSYGIARYLLGNELLTLDVFCILHLIAGYFITYLLLRRMKLHPSLAITGSLSFILSGYTLIAGRSWFTMVACVVWMPLLFFSVIELQQNKPTLKWVIGTGCILGIFYHLGHAQMWFYAAAFFLSAIVILFFLGRLPLSKALYLIPALLLGLAIIMPLLLPQWSVATDIQQRNAMDFDIPNKGILAMILPFPFVQAPHPEIGGGTAYDRQYIAPFYYSGTLFIAVFFAAILVGVTLLLFRKNKWLLLKMFVADNLWIVLALLAFILSLGNRGLLWALQTKLPLLNKFRMPFKFLHFVNLFAIMGSGIIIERVISHTHNKMFWRVLLGIAVCGLLLYNVSQSSASFYSYGDRPTQLQPFKDKHDIANFPVSYNARRILSLAANHSPKAGYIGSFNHNFPTLFGVYAFGGYDPFVDNSTYFTKAKQNLFLRPLAAARAYGIRLIIVDKSIEETEWIDNQTLELARFFLKHGIRHRTTSDYVILRLDNTQPMAFAQDNPQKSMPIYVRNNGIDIDVSRIYATGGRVIINMLWCPEIILMRGRERLKCGSDIWGRVVAEVPVLTQIIKFRYIPSWRTGFLAGVFFLFCSMLSFIFISRRLK